MALRQSRDSLKELVDKAQSCLSDTNVIPSRKEVSISAKQISKQSLAVALTCTQLASCASQIANHCLEVQRDVQRVLEICSSGSFHLHVKETFNSIVKTRLSTIFELVSSVERIIDGDINVAPVFTDVLAGDPIEQSSVQKKSVASVPNNHDTRCLETSGQCTQGIRSESPQSSPHHDGEIDDEPIGVDGLDCWDSLTKETKDTSQKPNETMVYNMVDKIGAGEEMPFCEKGPDAKPGQDPLDMGEEKSNAANIVESVERKSRTAKDTTTDEEVARNEVSADESAVDSGLPAISDNGSRFKCNAADYCLRPCGKMSYFGHDCGLCGRWIHFECAARRNGKTDLVCHLCWKEQNKVGPLRNWVPSDDSTWKEKKDDFDSMEKEHRISVPPKGLLPFTITMKERVAVADFNYDVYEINETYSISDDDAIQEAVMHLKEQYGLAQMEEEPIQANGHPVTKKKHTDDESCAATVNTVPGVSRKRTHSASRRSDWSPHRPIHTSRRSYKNPQRRPAKVYVMAILQKWKNLPFTIVEEKEYDSNIPIEFDVLEEDFLNDRKMIDESRWISRGATTTLKVDQSNRLRARMILENDGTMKPRDLFGIIYKLVKIFNMIEDVNEIVARTSEKWRNETSGIRGSENVILIDYVTELISRNIPMIDNHELK